MAGQGLRVLAFARGHMPADAAKLSHSDIAGGLSFLGLQGMIDLPRPEAIAAIHACRSAGISVKMITGDHALTASAIAVQMGLAAPCLDRTTQQECVLTGQQLAEMSDEELMSAVNNQSVLARVSPEQKLRVVEALQARGQVVAMTGDGVNDAPALKQADIGIAMGITGTEVAKEAAVMVLTDDNFSTIEAAVQEGRAVFDNLTKIIAWTLPTNIGQGMILVIAILLGLALPLLPVHILWINTVTAAILGLTLAVEIKEPDLMRRPPRLPNAPILTRPLLWRIILVATMIVIGAFGLYEVELARGVPVAQARTVAVNVVVMVELFYLFNSRSLSFSMFQIGLFSNKFIVIGAALMILVQLLFTYAPFMNTILSTAPISAVEWAAIVAVGLASYVVIEVEKAWRRRGATDA
jgi:Ca2+-transporting ATPase